MAYKLKLNDPTAPDDTEFDFGGVSVKNKSTMTMTEQDEQKVIARHGMSAKEVLGNHPFLEITGTTELSKKEVAEITGEGGES